MTDTKTIKNGLVIVFEGLDGVGKTTQISLAKKALEARGYSVVLSRNMGGSPIGEKLREVLFSDLPRPMLTNLYVGAAVQEALALELDKYRATGQIILLDRGPMSLAAYNMERRHEDKVWGFADEGVAKFKPDLFIFYKLAIDKAKDRVVGRGTALDYFESKPRSYFEDVLSVLEEGAERFNATRIAADGDIDSVHAATMQQIDKLL